MSSSKRIYVFVGGWILGRPKGGMGQISANTSPGGFIISGKPGGITTLELNPDNGEIKKVAFTADKIPVGYLALSPNSKYLYAAWEGNTYDGRVASGSCIYAYEINKDDGSLKFLNVKSAIGSCTNYLCTDSEGSYLFVSNHGEYGAISKVIKTPESKWEVQAKYDDSSLVVFHIKNDGSIGEPADVIVLSGDDLNPEAAWGAKGIGPHLHGVNIDPSDRLVIACDNEFGSLRAFHFDKNSGKLSLCPHSAFHLEGWRGVRHAHFHPTFPYIIAIAEGFRSFSYDINSGLLTPISCINGRALSLRLHPNGKFVYFNASSEIYVCAIKENGELYPIDQVTVPDGNFSRSCCFDPSGEFFFVTDVESDKVTFFRVEPDTGRLVFLNSIGSALGGASIRAAFL
jgi:6-phosphogluconolactonase (cycloisomerase 2 family)